ncbi:nucleotidyltransferase domain-containing protein [soil metagenome]
MNFPASVETAIKSHSYKLVFATVCGAHLAGLSSPKSAYELRGAHILPAKQVLGLVVNEETIELSPEVETSQIEFITQDIKKFFALMLKDNGYVLEQIYSPLVVHTSPEHDELKEIAKSCVTRLHCYHYLGYADSQWQLAMQENESQGLPKASQLLTIYRLLLTGTHLMQSGKIESNLASLNEKFSLPYFSELLERSQKEEQALAASEWQFHQDEYERLREMLEDSADATDLPVSSTAHDALDDLLKRIRLADLALAVR